MEVLFPLVYKFPMISLDLEFSAFLEAEYYYYQAEQDGIFKELQWGPHLFRWMERKHHVRKGSVIYTEF